MKNELFYGRTWRHREELDKAIHDYWCGRGFSDRMT
ncbi:hypothetical protein [Corynebacterium propinquum]